MFARLKVVFCELAAFLEDFGVSIVVLIVFIL